MPSHPTLRTTRTAAVLFTLAIAGAIPAQHDCRTTKQGLGRAQGHAKDAVVLWPLDILHQRIDLDLTTGNIITGHCTVSAVPREDGTTDFPLHLLALTVDSVTSPDGLLAFTHTGIDLNIALANPANTSDTLLLTVHYHGDPLLDASGFGGFYTTGQYSYNLGVAFTSVPHSYGRAWFPCADNFTERNSYEFHITTPSTWNAWCNGELIAESQPTPSTLLRHWQINETIPAYLASVSASNYAVVRDSFPSIAGPQIPVALVARPPDTTNMKNSFINLQACFDSFEDWFGAYRWNKVGYVLTPQGAMEHSTSIHYPQSIADGSLSYQDIMAHELGHQWFGDLVTCDRPEEMYINEGFAEYLSYLFIEAVNGEQAFLNIVRNNHKKMVHRAHLLDEGWWALDSVPQDWTYGEHSYNKGAAIAHTLRGYLGDSLFSAGFTDFLTAHAFQPVNTEIMRDHLTAATGVDLTDFFADWVQQPGWAAFELRDASAVESGGSWTVDLTITQKLRGPASFYHNVPVTLTMLGATATQQQRTTINVGGASTALQVSCPFEPHSYWLNDDDRLALAITGSFDTIPDGGFHPASLANMELVLPTPSDTSYIRTEHYWVGPDNAPVDEAFAFIVSPDRYWRVQGIFPDGVEARILFDGRNTATGNLDPLLMGDTLGFPFHEDSLVALYRTHPGAAWTQWSSTINTLGSATDGFGRITIDSIAQGEYTLAWRKSAVGITDETAGTIVWTISPNPAQGSVLVSAGRSDINGSVTLLDSIGRVSRTTQITDGLARFDLQGLARGSYHVQFTASDGMKTQSVGIVVVE